ncbi:Porphobilinogen deaminase [Gossypium australe]|uniref:Porphobilinogen deaminase n=1 Tax=Gossypium australe TaxID=47621 RepID=A0A5B6V5S9_9ROSI|nr:Porphobilinogen deaminase [Gossypium australe]
MASSISFTSTPSFASPCFHHKNPLPSFPIWVPCRNPTNSSASALFPICFAAKPQTGGPVKKRSSSAAGNKKRRKGKSGNDDGNLKEMSLRDVEIVEENDDFDEGSSSSSSSTSTTTRSLAYYSHPLPKPPAGFVVDDTGRVLMASNKRIASIVDSVNNNPLECVIRRVFKSSRGDECMLLCPVDMPVQILKSTNIDGWSAVCVLCQIGFICAFNHFRLVSDEEVEAILPTAEYALAKVHMHLVHSGFCYTARGGFCYSEDDIFDFRSGIFPLLALCFCFWLFTIF